MRNILSIITDPKSQKQSIKTPYLEIDLDKVRNSYEKIASHLSGVEIFYAMKCNPDPDIMRTVLNCGGQFEISSANEMKKAVAVGAKPKNILFSNPVKTPADIKRTYRAGVRQFAFDSYSEVDKLAENAPGAKVYVRLVIPVRKSSVPSEGKFGVSIDAAHELMLYAKSKGLQPYGVSFHVGSQMLDHESWGYAIQHSAKLFELLSKEGVELSFLDIGGGFPVCYDDVARDNLDKIASVVHSSIKKYIPKGTRLVAEPGRYMVAEAGTMVSTVIGVAERLGKKWIHLDVGALNGFMEALETLNTLNFPVHDSKKSKEKEIFALAGPTCDSQDTILYDVPVSSNIAVGDKLYFDFAGAYTTTYTKDFNGFPSPTTVISKKEKK